MKKIITFSIIIAPLFSLAQNEWNSTTTSTGAMYRTGNVAIGTSSSISAIPFVVKNPTSGQGTKVLFGAQTFVGTPVAADGLLQLQSTASSYIDLKGNFAIPLIFVPLIEITFEGILSWLTFETAVAATTVAVASVIVYQIASSLDTDDSGDVGPRKSLWRRSDF